MLGIPACHGVNKSPQTFTLGAGSAEQIYGYRPSEMLQSDNRSELKGDVDTLLRFK